jgi:ABC-type glutathione transport system ATPase component
MTSMVEPLRAAVRPRVISPETGDTVLLEDEVAEWLEGGSKTLGIVGGPGSGKTTALRHLVAVFGPLADVRWRRLATA